MPTDCPGYRLNAGQLDLIQRGVLDYTRRYGFEQRPEVVVVEPPQWWRGS